MILFYFTSFSHYIRTNPRHVCLYITEESSQQTWNSGPRNDTVANVEEMQNTPDMDDKEENEIKPKSILKKRSPGPVVTEKKNTFNAIFMALIMLAVLASKYYFHGTNFSAAPPVSDVEKSRGDVPRVVNLETYESTEGEPVDAVDEIENEGAVVKETTDDVSIDIKDEAPDIPNTVQDEIPSQKTDEDVSVEVHETNSKEDTSVMQESRQVDSDIVIESDDVEVDTEDTGVSTKETSQEAGAGKLVEDEAFQTKIDEDLEVKLDVEDISENEEEHESLDEEVVDVLKADINEMQNNYQATVNDVTISNENDENSSLEQIQDETEIGSQDDLVAKLQNQIESNPDAEIEEKPKAQFIKVFGQAGQIVKKKAQSMAKAISPQIQKGLKSRKPAIKKLQKQIEPTLKKFDPAAKRVQKKVTSVFNGINPARKRKADIS